MAQRPAQSAAAQTSDGAPMDPLRLEGIELMLRIGYLCNDAMLEHDKDMGYYLIGDPTEGALLTAALKAGIEPTDVTSKYPRIWEAPFDSTRKRMTTVNGSPEGRRLACVKGAPEMLLSLSERYYEGGEELLLTDGVRGEIKTAVDRMADDALRVLAVAYKMVEEGDDYDVEDVERNLVFVGLLGMIDPPRDEVSEAIKLCKKAGIRPVMITGDHELTAVAIAREVGILGVGGEAITGVNLMFIISITALYHQCSN